MFRNYLLVTFRKLYKNKVYALINILGLGLALAICIVAYFNHMFGYDFDRYNENFEEIYRVTSNRQMQDREQEFGIVPAPLGPEIKKDFPSITGAARIMRSYSPVKVGIDNFNRLISYVDPDFLDMFTFHLVSGNKQAILDPNNVLISEEMATALDDGVGLPLGPGHSGQEWPLTPLGHRILVAEATQERLLELLEHLPRLPVGRRLGVVR